MRDQIRKSWLCWVTVRVDCWALSTLQSQQSTVDRRVVMATNINGSREGHTLLHFGAIWQFQAVHWSFDSTSDAARALLAIFHLCTLPHCQLRASSEWNCVCVCLWLIGILALHYGSLACGLLWRIVEGCRKADSFNQSDINEKNVKGRVPTVLIIMANEVDESASRMFNERTATWDNKDEQGLL